MLPNRCPKSLWKKAQVTVVNMTWSTPRSPLKGRKHSQSTIVSGTNRNSIVLSAIRPMVTAGVPARLRSDP